MTPVQFCALWSPSNQGHSGALCQDGRQSTTVNRNPVWNFSEARMAEKRDSQPWEAMTRKLDDLRIGIEGSRSK